MNIFFCDQISGEIATLTEEESRHCIQVLRHKEGDEIHFIDGKGGWYRGSIIEAHKKHCQLRIVSAEQDFGKRSYSIHLAVAPTKNINRMEWLLEKATEIGLDTFTPILSSHSERRVIKPQRLEKIVLSAAKQSGKAFLPDIRPMVTFDKFLKAPIPEEGKFMAYLGEDVNGLLKQNYQSKSDVCLLIGPEGGFSVQEATAANAAGFKLVSLGEGRLRTETAALMACHTIHLLNS